MPHLQNIEREFPLHWALNPNVISHLYGKFSRKLWRCCTQLCHSPKFRRYVRFLESSLCQI
ncbi:uncharacterized protein [Drosophila kikkawai]|uniref:Uncharacterized protein n=1 Tax=Drosophila kikkawai TaxID=30033 RepID=A0A6P4JDR7_DROKI|nr:uncharacterized protein LOC108082299 [Drosophila kikkawai]